MRLGYENELFLLAIDHRTSLRRLLGAGDVTSADVTATLEDAKRLVHEGFVRAIEHGAPKHHCGLLIDEELGAEVARAAKAAGHLVALAVERSGQQVFELEYGDAFGEHIEAINPDFVKVLVRWNPGDPQPVREEQGARLRQLSDWLHTNDRRLLFELLVPPTDADLAQVDGDRNRYDVALRPALTLTAVEQLRSQQVEPDVWKIEGFERREDCVRLGRLIREGDGRELVTAVVLGRGADTTAVDRWLRAAAPVDGYHGFAIGRSIWADAVVSHLAGKLHRDDARTRIAAAFRRFIEVYRAASEALDADEVLE